MNGILSTERVMNYNWNVYKVFKNGKRAKAPLAEFEATETGYMQYFENEVKKNFNGSLRSDEFKLIRADLPQQRVAEQTDENEEKFSKEKNRVLGRLCVAAGIERGRAVSTALIYYAETGWKWQWAALQPATSKYIRGLSPKFNTHTEAEAWIETIISPPQ